MCERDHKVGLLECVVAGGGIRLSRLAQPGSVIGGSRPLRELQLRFQVVEGSELPPLRILLQGLPNDHLSKCYVT